MLIMFRYAWLPLSSFMNNKRRQEAYILTGFAAQRERVEGLAVFSKIAVECFSLFT